MWFIFISARRFSAGTASPLQTLRLGQASGCSVVNRLTRRMGLSPMNYASFAGCCGGNLCIENRALHRLPNPVVE